MIYDRYHTRKIADLGGLARRMPVLAFFFLVMTLSSIGLPGLNGFAGEFTLLLGMFHRAWADAPVAWAGQFRVISVLATLGVVLGAWYMLSLVQQVFFGPLKEPSVHAAGDDHAREPVRDLSFREVSALVPLCVFILWIGLWPDFFLSRLAPKVNAIAQQPAAALVSQTADGGRGTGDGGRWSGEEATRPRGEVRDLRSGIREIPPPEGTRGDAGRCANDSATTSGRNAMKLRARKRTTSANGSRHTPCAVRGLRQSAQRRTRVACDRQSVPRPPSAVPRPPAPGPRPPALSLLTPEIVLIAVAVAIFMFGALWESEGIGPWVALGGLIVAAIALAGQSPEPVGTPLVADKLAFYVRWLALGAGTLLMLLASRPAGRRARRSTSACSC